MEGKRERSYNAEKNAPSVQNEGNKTLHQKFKLVH